MKSIKKVGGVISYSVYIYINREIMKRRTLLDTHLPFRVMQYLSG